MSLFPARPAGLLVSPEQILPVRLSYHFCKTEAIYVVFLPVFGSRPVTDTLPLRGHIQISCTDQ